MNKRMIGADLLLLLTAAVWGFGFVAQRSGMRYVGPFAYNGIRFLLGSLSLLPLYFWKRRAAGLASSTRGEDLEREAGSQADAAPRPSVEARPPELPRSAEINPESRKRAGGSIISASLFAGTCIFIAVSLQQLGMMATTAGNAGFMTGLYVIFTPIFGIFLGKKTGKATWLGAFLTLAGLYFISTAGPLGGINPGDIVIIVSAVFWTFHILIIDRLVQDIDPIALSIGQFAVAGIYALAAALLLEGPLAAWLETAGRVFLPDGVFHWKSLPALAGGLRSGSVPLSLVSNALVPILYGGLASVGIGYTLQVVAQRNAPPAHATIILCLEGSFAVLGGILFLGEPVGRRAIIGFSLALAGMITSQWELIGGRNTKEAR